MSSRPPMPVNGDYKYIYCLYNSKGKLIYVGQTVNPYARWNSHKHHSWWAGKAHHYTAYRVPREEINAAEQAIIKKHKPLYNRVGSVLRKNPYERYFGLANFVGSSIGGYLGNSAALKLIEWIESKRNV